MFSRRLLEGKQEDRRRGATMRDKEIALKVRLGKTGCVLQLPPKDVLHVRLLVTLKCALICKNVCPVQFPFNA